MGGSQKPGLETGKGAGSPPNIVKAAKGGFEYWPVTRTDLDPHYDRVEKMLNVQQYPLDHPPYNTAHRALALKEAARRLNLNWYLPSLAVTFANYPLRITLAVEGEAPISTIADVLGIGSPTASHLVDRLVQAGLVHRMEHSLDRRYTLAHLTAEGETLLQRLRQGRLDPLRRWLVHLDERDLAALRQGLEALSHVMRTDSDLSSGDD